MAKKRKRPLKDCAKLSLTLSLEDMARADAITEFYGLATRASATRLALKRCYQRVMAGEKPPKFDGGKAVQNTPLPWRDDDLAAIEEIKRQTGIESLSGVIRLAIYWEWRESIG